MEIHRARKKTTSVHGRSHVRGRDRRMTDEGRENVTLVKHMAAIVEAISKSEGREMWAVMTMATTANLKTCTRQSESRPRRRVRLNQGQSQAGIMCRSRDLNQKPILHPRAAVLKHTRNEPSLVRGRVKISSPNHPKEGATHARLRP